MSTKCPGLTEEALGILKYFDYQPTKEECGRYSDSHTQLYAHLHFYLVNLRGHNSKPVNHTFSSGNMHGSNILELMITALKEGRFVSLEEISIKQYAQNGGGDIPCCLRNCQYEGAWPPCIKKTNS